MRWMRYLAAVAVAGLVAACGGGGSSTGSSGTDGGTTTPTTPTITVSLVNASDAALAVNSISKSAVFYAKAVVANANGTPLANQLVTFTTDYTVATLAGNAADAKALTDTSGVARVLISPLSLSTVGAGVLTASATVGSDEIASTLNFSTAAANVALANMTLSPATIGALETAAVTVQGLIDGVPATSSSVTVAFSASCGSFSPASASTNSSGIASATFQSTAACSGPVTLTAAGVGTNTTSTTVTVTPAKAANIVFSSATPTLMYVSSAASGSKTSVVQFQVLDSSASPMASQSVTMSLSNAAISAGVVFSLSGTTSTSPQVVTTDGGGYASITVAAGTLPTPVTVNAVLTSDTSIKAASLGLAVTNGAPTQNAASFNAAEHSLEGLNLVGLTTQLTLRIADRLGNPVPDGTVVNFIASAGLITPGSCTLTNSACSVTYTTQGTAPVGGRAVVMAYLDGEESFTDLNGDNIWQSGEPYTEMGLAYLDLNRDGLYDSTTEQSIPGGGTGNSVCTQQNFFYPSAANTCDGTWSGNIRVRVMDVITWATSKAVIKLPEAQVPAQTWTATGFTVLVHDDSTAASPFNAMPSGTTVAAAVTTTGASCAVTSVNPATVNGSAVSGTYHTVILNGDASCTTGAAITITVTSPSGYVTTRVLSSSTTPD